MQEIMSVYDGPGAHSYWLMQIYLEDNFIHGAVEMKTQQVLVVRCKDRSQVGTERVIITEI